MTRYLKMTLEQYSFWEILFDIRKIYGLNNYIVIGPIPAEYCVNIDSILSASLK